MRIIFTPLLILSCLAATAQDGVVDGSFGNSGKQITYPNAPVNMDFEKIAVISGGRILQAFSVYNNSTGNYDFALARFESDGSLDVTFDGDSGNGNGIVTTDFGGDDVATALTVRPDGKIILVGYKLTSSSRSFAIARYNSNGTLDQTFDGESGVGNGKITTSFNGVDDAAYGVLENNGITVVVGYTWTGSSFDFAIARYNNNGTLDQSFDGDTGNGNGKVVTSIGSVTDNALSITVQLDGKIIVGGFSFDGSSTVFALARYNINGTLDQTFDGDSGNGNGIVTKAISTGGDDAIYDVATKNGKIIAVGSAYTGTNYDFAVVRYNANGTLDQTFDGESGVGNGIVLTPILNGDDRAYSVALQTDGKIVAAGVAHNGLNFDFAIARYNTDGTLDQTFNSGASAPVRPGTNVIDFGDDDYGYAIAPQGNYIIFAGRSLTNLAATRLISSSAILPLSLNNFIASKQTGSVLLNWQTLNEENTAYFDVERSSDGVRFTKVGTVQAAANASGAGDYNFTDAQPLPTVNFYRLRMVGVNHAVSYSKIIVVRFSGKGALQVFPNPVESTLYLQVTLPAGPVQVQLADTRGRVLQSLQLRSSGSSLSTSLDLSRLSKGIYFIKVNEETVKILKD